jgi:hypothetical protein
MLSDVTSRQFVQYLLDHGDAIADVTVVTDDGGATSGLVQDIGLASDAVTLCEHVAEKAEPRLVELDYGRIAKIKVTLHGGDSARFLADA